MVLTTEEMSAPRSDAGWRRSGAAGLLIVVAVVVASVMLATRSTGGSPVVHKIAIEDLRYHPGTINIRSGEVQLDISNRDAISHSFTVKALGVHELIGEGETTTVKFFAHRGTYSIICTLPGHLSSGMRAQLRVT